MMKKFLLSLAVGVALVPMVVQAQTNNNEDTEKRYTDTTQKIHFWSASVGGGHYMVKLGSIQSISRHQYVLDGAVIVDEVTVDSLGQALARFYHIRPISDSVTGNSAAAAAARMAERGKNLVDKAAERAGSNIQNMVVKKFPETTHARTLEYRVLYEDELSALYSSVQTALTSGRGRKFAIK